MDTAENLHNISVVIFDDLSAILYAVFPIDAVTACMTFVEFVALVNDHRACLRKSFLLIIALIFGYFLSSCGSILSSGVSCVMRLIQGDCVMNLRSCLCLQLVHSVGYILVIASSFLLAVDRTLAIVTPVWYNRDYKNSWLYGQFVLVLFYIALINVGMYLSSNHQDIPYCTMISSRENQFLMFENLVNNVLLALTVAVYIALIVWVKWKLYKDRENVVLQMTHQRRMKSKLLLTLATCVFIHAATFYLGTIFGSIAIASDNIVEAMSLAKYGILVVISGLLNAIFLFCRTREIKLAVRRLLKKCGLEQLFTKSSSILPSSNRTHTVGIGTSTTEQLKTWECA
ncbi:7TM GPCR Srsx domain containing protein [Trichuris trichiura]|uniref:7TM GPCR Srsx domain containing protein n=1 Tax=Trichuris trichiura TaxID=36087 RepID=A0A077YXP3_TRITR|nr:7TM GPCR Srsx domain containing protein [Trichuris trichiura]